MDIKFIGSGPSAKAVIYYITDYITKSQLKTHVAFAALELAIKKLNETENEDDTVTIRAKRLLQKCTYAMVSHQELSAQQVCSYLMDFEDHFTSHEYWNVFWRSFEIYVDRTLPLRCADATASDDQMDTDSSNGLEDEEDETCEINLPDEVGIATNLSGEIVPKNGQVLDYIRRGDGLQEVCLWEYVACIQKLTKKWVSHRSNNRGSLQQADKLEIDMAFKSIATTRAKYMFSVSHPDHESHIQQVCRPEKRLTPVPIGPPLPCRDREEDMTRYHRLMLILFKLWSNPRDLISGIHAPNVEDALKTAFENMAQEFPKIRMLLANMQALHKCKDSCDDHFLARQSSQKSNVSHQQCNREDICDDFTIGNPDEIDDEILEHLNQMECS